ncbi:putative multiple-sugar transport system permease YteP [compost metagenome]
MVFEVGDILDTYIYRVGIEQFNLSLATAADVIKGVIGFVLVLLANQFAKRICFNDSMMAMKRFYELHREKPNREYVFFHTSREKLQLREKWSGVRRPK